MTDREKVIKGLRQHVEGSMFDRCGECPYYEFDKDGFWCRDELLRDVLALLKEQEAKQVIGIADSIEGMEVGYCPSCDRAIVNKKIDETKYCKFCGQAVKWNES